ncbi:type II toxin-antitoxin system RelE/ParE family toxin [Algoriphagus terrigena]|uniref:type II toxin-antitoxin system RelE/ParE family toxin n=1 Tax=Algoriphagus terrigena TaxID=344884 RepID=UPI00041CECE0|nr:type II toxin-antitoxin system RelE/ParE family toxin [Algoriphagus terrigena]
MNYRLSQEAEDDLIRIYRFGFYRFGEAQADRYFEALYLCFDQIAKNPEQYPTADRIRRDYRFCVLGPNTIYFKVENQGIVEIIRIIGKQNF